MRASDYIELGLSKEENYLVEDQHTAIHIGSGGSRVLATPWLIAFVERTAHRILASRLPEGYSTVGILINFRHLAPTPIGTGVRVHVEVREVDANRVILDVEAYDAREQIGAGEHQRYVIEEERFLKRVMAKAEETSPG